VGNPAAAMRWVTFVLQITIVVSEAVVVIGSGKTKKRKDDNEDPVRPM
jgi:hypothetical protein